LIVTGAWLFATQKKPVEKTAVFQKQAVSNLSGIFSAGQEELLRTLAEKEKRVLEKALEEDGQSQKTLLHKTGLSKATLSRTLKNLEQKQFIRLVQDGYTNRIYITEWFRNK